MSIFLIFLLVLLILPHAGAGEKNIQPPYYDLAVLAYEKGNYTQAEHYFKRAVKFNLGETKKALEKFTYVTDYTDLSTLTEKAANWIKVTKKQKEFLKPYSIYFKISYQYGDDVRCKGIDPDSYIKEDGYFAGILLLSRFNFLNRQSYQIGAGYDHYQTWNNDVDGYDLRGSILSLYARYYFNSFRLGFNYLPSYYWLGSDSYLSRQQLRPEILWKINKNFFAKLSYSYYDNNYFHTNHNHNYDCSYDYDPADQDGHASEVFMDVYYKTGDGNTYLFGGIGYEDNTSSHPDYYYGQLETKLGIYLNIPWKLRLGSTGKYYRKEYDNIDSDFGLKRHDDKYCCTLSISRKLFYDRLDIIAEFNYTKNYSNINEYEYKRHGAGLSLAVSY